MKLVSNNPQGFITLIAILGAAAAAIFCDLLKRKNDHLREVNLELRVRHEEEVRHNQILLQTIAADPAAAIAGAAGTPSALQVPGADSLSATAEVALDRGAELTSRRGKRGAPANLETAAAAPQTGSSLVEARLLAREFLGRAASRSAAERKEEEFARSSAVREPEVIVEKSAGDPSRGMRKNWDELLSNLKRQYSVEVESCASLALPGGFHEGMALARIMNSEKAVLGLLAVIGINDLAERRENSGGLSVEELIAGVGDHIRSILRAGEFACRSSQDEFVIISPDANGPELHRRLSEIAESLWQYQLRTLGSSKLLFSWGGAEAKGEAFADVLAVASERMREMRGNRRSLLEAPAQRRAV